MQGQQAVCASSPQRAARRRKSLEEIFAGLSPKNPLLPRKLDEALAFKQHKENLKLYTAGCSHDGATYDEVIIKARCDHEHVDEDTKRQLEKKKRSCDVQGRFWQWLKVAM
jgi:hypothetical protein